MVTTNEEWIERLWRHVTYRRPRAFAPPKPETCFGLDDVLRAIAEGPKTTDELREALGLKTPGYDNFWLERAKARLKARGEIVAIGHAGGARWMLAPCVRICPCCGATSEPRRCERPSP